MSLVPVLARSLAGLLLLAGLDGTRALAAPVSFVVDPARSHLRLHLGRAGLFKFMGHEHHIEAPLAEGRVLVVEGDPVRSSVQLRFESAKLALIPGSEPEGDIPKVEERMRGPEVLDVARYPEIAFASTSVVAQPAGGSGLRVVVIGTLTLRGRSFPVEVPLDVVHAAGGPLEARGELSLNLRDLGIEPPSVASVVNVANRFRLEFEIRAKAEAGHP